MRTVTCRNEFLGVSGYLEIHSYDGCECNMGFRNVRIPQSVFNVNVVCDEFEVLSRFDLAATEAWGHGRLGAEHCLVA